MQLIWMKRYKKTDKEKAKKKPNKKIEKIKKTEIQKQ